jgi:hypothetical protein
MRDRYGLHAYLTALENAGQQAKLESETRASKQVNKRTKTMLLEVLRTGTLPAEGLPSQKRARAAVGSSS